MGNEEDRTARHAACSHGDDGHAADATCGWEGAASSSFDSLASLTSPGAAARGAGEIGREPTLNENYEALPESANGKGGKKFRATVPTYFHVITDGTTGNVTDAQIADQINVLNLAFAGFYGGAKSGFQYELEGITRTDNAEWFNAKAGTNPERSMKNTLRRGGFESLNIYSNLAGGYLGYAYLPGLPDSRLAIDGIVLHWGSLPGSGMFVGRYDLGMTLVHEAGHWVNLEHTFAGGCNAKGDSVDDTPAMLVPTSGCPAGKDTCPKEPGLDPIHNYMDYSYDTCYNQFTPGQVARAQDSWIYFRA
ncbi:MAG: zinc metalloprotease [Actinobacteria bacterium]|nr:zinc metalloprotease [Actinomycetota bacterium]